MGLGLALFLTGFLLCNVIGLYLQLATSAALRVYGESLLVWIGRRKLQDLADKTFCYLLASFEDRKDRDLDLDHFVRRQGPELLNDLLMQNGYNVREYDARDIVPAFWVDFKRRCHGHEALARDLVEGGARKE